MHGTTLTLHIHRHITEDGSTEDDGMATRRNRAFAEALERDPERRFLRREW